ncbi:MAG: hypothetical protein NVV62_02475 [Terricaulis sp.]|nr:hypothetical protein [Terricaulis sp.]
MIDLLFIALMQAAVATTEPAAPPPTPETQAAQGEQAEAPPEAVRCRMVRVENSNLRQRRCTTRAQDEAMNQATSRELREMQSQAGRGGDRTFGSGGVQ